MEVGACEAPIIVPVQQTFEPGEKSAVGLTSSSYFAAPGTGVHEKNGSNTSVSVMRSDDGRRGGCRPGPGEGLHGRRNASVVLRVHRRHAPVVRARRKEECAGRVRGPGGLDALLAADRGAELRVARDRHQVFRGMWHCRPTEDERVGRVRDDCPVCRRLQGRRERPALAQLPRRRPRGDRAVRAHCADTPVVRAVRDRLLQGRPAVAGEELVLALAENRRVEAGVGRELELVPRGAGDGAPRERRKGLRARACDGSQRARRDKRRARRGCGTCKKKCCGCREGA